MFTLCIRMYMLCVQEPKVIDSLKTVKCISVAAARDHTIIADERYIISKYNLHNFIYAYIYTLCIYNNYSYSMELCNRVIDICTYHIICDPICENPA